MEGKFQKIEDIRKKWAEYTPPPTDPIKEEDKKSKKEKKPKEKEEEEKEEGEVLKTSSKPEKASKGIVAVQIEKAPAKLRPQTGTVIGLPKKQPKNVWRW